MKNEISKNNILTIAEAIDTASNELAPILSNKEIQGFVRAYQLGVATQRIQDLLTNEYMSAIMPLMNTSLGFKTDKNGKKLGTDGTSTYSVEVVKSCLIEAVLLGLQPTGNQFNIIAGNCYIATNGCSAMLNARIAQGVIKSYEILPSIVGNIVTAEFVKVDIVVKWTDADNVSHEKKIERMIKSGAYGSGDSVIAKSERKAKYWLLQEIDKQTYQFNDDEAIVKVEQVKATSVVNSLSQDVKDEEAEINTLVDFFKKIEKIEDSNVRVDKILSVQQHELYIKYQNREEIQEWINNLKDSV